MHEIQQALLNVLEERGITELPPLRRLAELMGKQISAQQVKHHLHQLVKKGFVTLNEKTREIKIGRSTIRGVEDTSLVTLPIYGTANCGPALNIADQRAEAFLKISHSLIKKSNPKNLFVVKASGNSMNRSDIQGKNIDDGDYLVVDSSLRNPKGEGEVVLSIIDGAANIKRIFREPEHYILSSDSSEEYPPIYIGADDDFYVNGTVVQVLKRPRK